MKRFLLHYFPTLVCFVFALLPVSPKTFAQETEADNSPFLAPLFEGENILPVTITTDFKDLLKDRGEERKSHRGMLSYVNTVGDSVILPVKLKVRGNFRRQKGNCGFPPLRVNFDKDSVAGTVFAHQDKIKLVTHCQSNREVYEQYVVLEYLIYKMYQQITPNSFNVRMTKVRYVDESGKYDTMEKLGFFIESEDHLAMRMDGRILDMSNIHPDKTNYKMVNDLAVFMYMIGNTDFSVSGPHNVKLVMTHPADPPIAVPYDFDWSGLVNPPYAVPNPQLPINSVRERLFRGFCRTEAEFEDCFQLFREKKDSFYGLIEKNELLMDKTRKDAIKYLDGFYEIINTPSMAKREIIDGCRTTQ